MKVNELIEQLKHTYENCNILKPQYVRESIKEAISIMESLQGQIAEYEKAINCKSCDCNICIAHENILRLRAQLAESQRRERAAVEDIAMAHKHGLCEVCGRMPHCLMSLNHGCGAEEGTVCDGDKWEWRGNAGEG